MKVLSVLFLTLLLCFATNCREEPDCVHYTPTSRIYVPFIFLDRNTNENLVQDGHFSNPKRITVDSLRLFSSSLDTLPDYQWRIRKAGHGYLIYIYVFDQSQVPEVDTATPSSVTYYIYSGNFDFDTIAFNYHFQPKRYCYSVTNDTLKAFVNGEQTTFSTQAIEKNAYVILK